MAGVTTVFANHNAERIASPAADWGVMQGNPIFEEINEIADRIENHFLLNVSLNKDKEVTGVFAGERRAAHLAGCEFIREHAMVPVATPSDIMETLAKLIAEKGPQTIPYLT